METKDYTQEIIDIIRSNTSPAVMSSRLEDYHANDLAEVLKKLTVRNAASCTGSWIRICFRIF